MKGTYVKKIWMKYLAKFLGEQYVCQGNLIFKKPLQWFIHGLYFESSAYSTDSCYLWAFGSMVFPPREGLSFHFGDRIGNFDINPANELVVMPRIVSAIRGKGFRIIDQFDRPEWLLNKAREIKHDKFAINDKERLAYAYLLAGEYKEVHPLLEVVLIGCLEDIVKFPQATGSRDRKERVELIMRLMDEDPALAVNQLKEWRMVTLKNLKLDKYAAEV
jgi:hypothetical protein